MNIRDEHVLPTVRIQKIVLENFKSVKYGEVLFNCGRKRVPQDTESDILGIYGQNGSGKTAVIEALAILKSAMSGRPIEARYTDCIAVGADHAKFSFTFDLQYPPDNRTRTIVYSFKMGVLSNEDYYDFNNVTEFEDLELDLSLSSFYESKIRVFDETISAGGCFNDSAQKMQDILTTNGKSYPIGPVRKISYYVGNNKESSAIDLEVYKRTASVSSKSFIFSKETMDLFESNSDYSEYYQVLVELKLFAARYLFVVDTRLAGLGGSPMMLPLFTRMGLMPVSLLGPITKYPQEMFEEFERAISGINMVLPTLVAGLKLEIVHDEVVVRNKKSQETRLYSVRKDCRIPLRSESAGLIRIISILSLVISSYNNKSTTVAIDELDAGIYEYLLGELLTGLETYGKGQFIFTSHNLRPLEVLKKENIVFTTANPENRYIRLKGVGHSNNLRSLYLREILSDSQDERIYDAAKRQRMNAAFMRAGEAYGETE